MLVSNTKQTQAERPSRCCEVLEKECVYFVIKLRPAGAPSKLCHPRHPTFRKASINPALPAPDLIRVLLALGLWHVPRQEAKEEHRKCRKD